MTELDPDAPVGIDVILVLGPVPSEIFEAILFDFWTCFGRLFEDTSGPLELRYIFLRVRVISVLR